MTDSAPSRGQNLLSKIYAPGSAPKSIGVTIFGRGGAGKTTLVGTMPGRGLVLDVPQVEGGTFVLGKQADRVDILAVEQWGDIDEAYSFLSTINPTLEKDKKYSWVAIDSITAMQELAKRKTIKERDLSADPHIIALQEYGKIGQLLGELVYRFRVLPIHTIWIAQERRFSRGEEMTGLVGPDIIPSALSALLPSMMLCAHLSVHQNSAGGTERHLRIGAHTDYACKYRALPDLPVPQVIRNPDLGHILRYLLTGTGTAPDPVEEIPVPMISFS